jgi:hypothetical protein
MAEQSMGLFEKDKLPVVANVEQVINHQCSMRKQAHTPA